VPETTDRSPGLVPRAIDHERALLREAIFMVANGTAPRVVVASLRFGEALLNDARVMAATAGVHVVPLWTLDEANHAIAVEPGAAEPGIA
jgi:hypothetical protein